MKFYLKNYNNKDQKINKDFNPYFNNNNNNKHNNN